MTPPSDDNVAPEGATRPVRAVAAVGAVTDAVAEAVVDVFLERHPDWIDRFGAERVRRHGIEVARHHLRFLVGSIRGGSPAAFAQYAAWAASMLERRGIGRELLRENLEQIERELAVRLPGHSDMVGAHFAAAYDALSVAAEATSIIDHLGTASGIYLQALLTGQRTAALMVAQEALAGGLSLTDLYVDVIEAAQRELGDRWVRNEITIADEHVATAITQYVLNSVYEQVSTTVRRGDAVVTGVSGEMHQLGAHMIADAFEADGWSVRFLGTDIPHRDVLAAVEAARPRLVAVSATMLFNLPAAAELVTDLRRQQPAACIIVGGRAFQAAPEAWREMGADGMEHDVRGALRLAQELFGAA